MHRALTPLAGLLLVLAAGPALAQSPADAWIDGLVDVAGGSAGPLQRDELVDADAEGQPQVQAHGIGVALDGVSVYRYRFSDPLVARRWAADRLTDAGGAQLRAIDVRGRQALVLDGERLVDPRLAEGLRRAGWAIQAEAGASSLLAIREGRRVAVLAGQAEVEGQDLFDSEALAERYAGLGGDPSSFGDDALPAAGPGAEAREGAAPPVVVVAIDAATTDALGPFGPAYRQHHVALLEQLAAADARGAGFVMSFTDEPTVAEASERLAAAMRASPFPVVVARRAEPRPTGGWRVLQNALPFQDPAIGEAVVVASNEALRDAGSPWVVGPSLLPEEVHGFRSLYEELALRTGDLRPRELSALGLMAEHPVLARGRDGRLRVGRSRGFRPGLDALEALRTVRYGDLIAGRVEASVLAGALVIVGPTEAATASPEPEAAPVSWPHVAAVALRRAVDEAYEHLDEDHEARRLDEQATRVAAAARRR